LPDFWLNKFAGVELWQWAAVLIQILAFVLTYAVVRVISSRVLRYRPVGDTEAAARKNRKQISRALASTLGAAASSAVVTGSELTPWLEHPMTLVFRLATLVGMMLLANALWDLVCDGIVYHSDSKKTAQLLVPVTRKLVRFSILVVGGLVALGMVGVDIAVRWADHTVDAMADAFGSGQNDGEKVKALQAEIEALRREIEDLQRELNEERQAYSELEEDLERVQQELEEQRRKHKQESFDALAAALEREREGEAREGGGGGPADVCV
jgi:hypothetical protein